MIDPAKKLLFYLANLLVLIGISSATKPSMGALSALSCEEAVLVGFVDQDLTDYLAQAVIETHYGQVELSYLIDGDTTEGLVRVTLSQKSMAQVFTDIKNLVNAQSSINPYLIIQIDNHKDNSQLVTLEYTVQPNKVSATQKFIHLLRGYLSSIYHTSDLKDISLFAINQWRVVGENETSLEKFYPIFMERAAQFLSLLSPQQKQLFFRFVYPRPQESMYENIEIPFEPGDFGFSRRRPFLLAIENLYNEFRDYLSLDSTSVHVVFFEANKTRKIVKPLLNNEVYDVRQLANFSKDEIAAFFKGDYSLVEIALEALAQLNLRPAQKGSLGRSTTLTRFEGPKKAKTLNERRYALEDAILLDPVRYTDYYYSGEDKQGWFSPLNRGEEDLLSSLQGYSVDSKSLEPKAQLDQTVALQMGLYDSGQKFNNDLDEQVLIIEDLNLSPELLHVLGTAGLDSPESLALTEVREFESLPAMTKSLFYELLESMGAVGLNPWRIGTASGRRVMNQSGRLALPVNIDSGRLRPKPNEF